MGNPKKTAPKAASLPAGVDLKEVERLLEFMGQHGLEEFEYGRDSFHVRLKKAAAHGSAVARSFVPPEVHLGSPAHSAHAPAHASAVAHAPAGGEAAADADLHIIKSPIVGTFFGAPTPGADPFVRQGDKVKSGQVLCIVEAMKLMNEIESDTDGEVKRIFVENGQAVEYGEPLFGIHPRGKK